MMYFDFNVGNKTYKLRLNTRNIVALEKVLDCNPLSIFGSGERIPTITEMINILHYSLQQYEHGITLNDSYDIFDKWLEDGHMPTEFITTIIEIYKVSGILRSENSNEKN